MSMPTTSNLKGRSDPPSFTEKSIRKHMHSILAALTKPGDFTVRKGAQNFKRWVNCSDMTMQEKKIVGAIFHEILVEVERRARVIRQELDDQVFRRNGG